MANTKFDGTALVIARYKGARNSGKNIRSMQILDEIFDLAIGGDTRAESYLEEIGALDLD